MADTPEIDINLKADPSASNVPSLNGSMRAATQSGQSSHKSLSESIVLQKKKVLEEDEELFQELIIKYGAAKAQAIRNSVSQKLESAQAGLARQNGSKLSAGVLLEKIEEALYGKGGALELFVPQGGKEKGRKELHIALEKMLQRNLEVEAAAQRARELADEAQKGLDNSNKYFTVKSSPAAKREITQDISLAQQYEQKLSAAAAHFGEMRAMPGIKHWKEEADKAQAAYLQQLESMRKEFAKDPILIKHLEASAQLSHDRARAERLSKEIWHGGYQVGAHDGRSEQSTHKYWVDSLLLENAEFLDSHPQYAAQLEDHRKAAQAIGKADKDAAAACAKDIYDELSDAFEDDDYILAKIRNLTPKQRQLLISVYLESYQENLYQNILSDCWEGNAAEAKTLLYDNNLTFESVRQALPAEELDAQFAKTGTANAEIAALCSASPVHAAVITIHDVILSSRQPTVEVLQILQDNKENISAIAQSFKQRYKLDILQALQQKNLHVDSKKDLPVEAKSQLVTDIEAGKWGPHLVQLALENFTSKNPYSERTLKEAHNAASQALLQNALQGKSAPQELLDLQLVLSAVVCGRRSAEIEAAEHVDAHSQADAERNWENMRSRMEVALPKDSPMLALIEQVYQSTKTNRSLTIAAMFARRCGDLSMRQHKEGVQDDALSYSGRAKSRWQHYKNSHPELIAKNPTAMEQSFENGRADGVRFRKEANALSLDYHKELAGLGGNANKAAQVFKQQDSEKRALIANLYLNEFEETTMQAAHGDFSGADLDLVSAAINDDKAAIAAAEIAIENDAWFYVDAQKIYASLRSLDNPELQAACEKTFAERYANNFYIKRKLVQLSASVALPVLPATMVDLSKELKKPSSLKEALSLTLKPEEVKVAEAFLANNTALADARIVKNLEKSSFWLGKAEPDKILAHLQTFRDKQSGVLDMKRLKEFAAAFEKENKQSFSEFAKSLPGKMGLAIAAYDPGVIEDPFQLEALTRAAQLNAAWGPINPDEEMFNSALSAPEQLRSRIDALERQYGSLDTDAIKDLPENVRIQIEEARKELARWPAINKKAEEIHDSINGNSPGTLQKRLSNLGSHDSKVAQELFKEARLDLAWQLWDSMHGAGTSKAPSAIIGECTRRGADFMEKKFATEAVAGEGESLEDWIGNEGDWFAGDTSGDERFDARYFLKGQPETVDNALELLIIKYKHENDSWGWFAGDEREKMRDEYKAFLREAAPEALASFEAYFTINDQLQASNSSAKEKQKILAKAWKAHVNALEIARENSKSVRLTTEQLARFNQFESAAGVFRAKSDMVGDMACQTCVYTGMVVGICLSGGTATPILVVGGLSTAGGVVLKYGNKGWESVSQEELLQDGITTVMAVAVPPAIAKTAAATKGPLSVIGKAMPSKFILSRGGQAMVDRGAVAIGSELSSAVLPIIGQRTNLIASIGAETLDNLYFSLGITSFQSAASAFASESTYIDGLEGFGSSVLERFKGSMSHFHETAAMALLGQAAYRIRTQSRILSLSATDKVVDNIAMTPKDAAAHGDSSPVSQFSERGQNYLKQRFDEYGMLMRSDIKAAKQMAAKLDVDQSSAFIDKLQRAVKAEPGNQVLQQKLSNAQTIAAEYGTLSKYDVRVLKGEAVEIGAATRAQLEQHSAAAAKKAVDINTKLTHADAHSSTLDSLSKAVEVAAARVQGLQKQLAASDAAIAAAKAKATEFIAQLPKPTATREDLQVKADTQLEPVKKAPAAVTDEMPSLETQIANVKESLKRDLAVADDLTKSPEIREIARGAAERTRELLEKIQAEHAAANKQPSAEDLAYQAHIKAREAEVRRNAQESMREKEEIVRAKVAADSKQRLDNPARPKVREDYDAWQAANEREQTLARLLREPRRNVQASHREPVRTASPVAEDVEVVGKYLKLPQRDNVKLNRVFELDALIANLEKGVVEVPTLRDALIEYKGERAGLIGEMRRSLEPVISSTTKTTVRSEGTANDNHFSVPQERKIVSAFEKQGGDSGVLKEFSNVERMMQAVEGKNSPDARRQLQSLREDRNVLLEKMSDYLDNPYIKKDGYSPDSEGFGGWGGGSRPSGDDGGAVLTATSQSRTSLSSTVVLEAPAPIHISDVDNGLATQTNLPQNKLNQPKGVKTKPSLQLVKQQELQNPQSGDSIPAPSGRKVMERVRGVDVERQGRIDFQELLSKPLAPKTAAQESTARPSGSAKSTFEELLERPFPAKVGQRNSNLDAESGAVPARLKLAPVEQNARRVIYAEPYVDIRLQNLLKQLEAPAPKLAAAGKKIPALKMQVAAAPNHTIKPFVHAKPLAASHSAPHPAAVTSTQMQVVPQPQKKKQKEDESFELDPDQNHIVRQEEKKKKRIIEEHEIKRRKDKERVNCRHPFHSSASMQLQCGGRCPSCKSKN